jgi:hypothetical protein
MKQIKLYIEEHNLETVLTILNNLKTGLKDSNESNGINTSSSVRYQPKLNKVIREDE